MKNFRVIWMERHSTHIEAESEEQAQSMFDDGKIDEIVAPSDSYIEKELSYIDQICNSHDALLNACKNALIDDDDHARQVIEEAIALAEKGGV